MYNLRSRGRVSSAGSARPHLGMGARALPAVASQVTPSQAVAMVQETELFGDDEIISDTLDEVNAANLEATQPPILSPIQPLDPILFTNNE